MKSIINILLMFSLFTSIILADISKVQLDKYIKVSIANKLLQSNSRILLKKTLAFYDNDITKAKEFIYNKKYSLIYFEAYKKFNIEDYEKIMKFYETDLGKKYVNAENEVLMLSSKKEIQNKFMNLQISKEKEKLIDLIIQAYDTIEYKMKDAIRYFEIYNEGLPVKMQISEQKMEEQIKRYRAAMTRYQKGLSKLIYHSFSEEELIQLLSFAESMAGQNENELKYESQYSYMETIMKDLMIHVREVIK